jgi:hypothetical protein
MTEEPKDNNRDDEIINIRLPRSDYELLRLILKEREAKNWLTAKVSSWWIFGLGAGCLVLWKLWTEFSTVVHGGS